MKIWYQSYSPIGHDPKWKKYEEDLKRYVQKVSRPDTKVDVYGVDKIASKLTDSDYIQYMHISGVIENAFRAEREGYDAFCLGGTLDLGAVYLREVLDIPVAFIAESSFYIACLMARKFSIIAVNEGMLRRQMELIRNNGLEERCIPGVHMKTEMLEIVENFNKNPKHVVDMFYEAAEKVIAMGAGALIPGFGAISSFFGQQGIHDVNTVPIIDITASVIKVAEILVDLHKTGVKRSKKGIFDYPSKEELISARKLYGYE